MCHVVNLGIIIRSSLPLLNLKSIVGRNPATSRQRYRVFKLFVNHSTNKEIFIELDWIASGDVLMVSDKNRG
ncbi:hypothetical protein M378DRAFT_397158 [Amanita muscaria Koide BX008]|uniref:Uncharacterized protein n=1 Tax=Amanita muscaria (strain Koide BX008) TaxID=946122 RepID=A0A0C2W7X1_AMAMK|nr:hypothetical protein M378DRAFT_397158 [Amanita muscaria Koide BX008]